MMPNRRLPAFIAPFGRMFGRIDFMTKISYRGFEREGRIQSAERAVPTFISTSSTNLLSA